MTYMGDNFNNTNCGLLSGRLSGPEQGLIIHGPSTRPSLVSVKEVLRDHGSTLLSAVLLDNCRLESCNRYLVALSV